MIGVVYKPKGFYTSKGRFRARSYYHEVVMSSPFSRGTQEVLIAMCWAASFDEPSVKITKPQIMKITGAKQQRHVITAFNKLKEVGMIRVVSGGAGGKGVAPKYEIRPYGDVAPEIEPEQAPVDEAGLTEIHKITIEKINGYKERGVKPPDFLVKCLPNGLQEQYN